MVLQIHNFDNKFSEIIEKIFRESFNYIGSLDEIHELLEGEKISIDDKEYHKRVHEWKKDRDSIFIKKFHEYVDKNTIFNETYYKFIRENIMPLFPNEKRLVVQKTPNIRFSLPETAAIGFDKNDPKDIIGLHCDSDFGHHFTEQNFIIPITKMFDSNSIYHEPFIGSGIEPKNYECLLLNETNKFVNSYFNKIKHCNRINKTKKTRISFDIRVIPYSEYKKNSEYFEGTKFELGNYYIVV